MRLKTTTSLALQATKDTGSLEAQQRYTDNGRQDDQPERGQNANRLTNDDEAGDLDERCDQKDHQWQAHVSLQTPL